MNLYQSEPGILDVRRCLLPPRPGLDQKRRADLEPTLSLTIFIFVLF